MEVYKYELNIIEFCSWYSECLFTCLYNVYSTSLISGFWKLTKKDAQSWNTMDNFLNKDFGIWLKMLNLFNVLIALSTWILARAIVFVFSTSLGVNCEEVRNGGMFKETTSGKMSDIGNPFSANIRSPDSNKLKIPQCPSIFLSEVDPGYNLLTNVTTPLGATPISPLLYFYVCMNWK